MATWRIPATLQIPTELNNAINIMRRRLHINRYRSRTEVMEDHILTALSWMKLARLENNELIAPSQNYTSYIVRAVQRGTDPETVKQETLSYINDVIEASSRHNIITFNTATAAAASEAIKTAIDTDQRFTELDVIPMITSTPNHRIHIYKTATDEGKRMYLILNNVDTVTVLFKIAAAIMLDTGWFKEDMVTAWMSGNADDIITAVTNYYKEYNDTKKDREFNNALKSIVNNIVNAKKGMFESQINQYQAQIVDYYDHIRNITEKLNDVKGRYLLQLTLNEDQKLTDLQKFIENCKENIGFLKTNENVITIVYKTPLIYFDETLLKPYYDSHRDNVINTAIPWKQQLLKDIFFEKKYTLLIESSIAMNLQSARFQYVPVGNYIQGSETTGIPNPHHKYYNCWGDNEPTIFRAIQDADYVTAFTTAFAAMAGINLADTAVVNKFVNEEICNYDTVPCLKDNSTGETISFSEYGRRYNNASNEIHEQTDTGNAEQV